MNRTEKQTFVGDFREKLREAPALYLTDFTGLDVKSMSVLRQRLKDSGAEYLVVKNRLVKLAVADLDLPDISEALLGPTGVVLSYEGTVEPAKAVRDFAKEHDNKPVFKLGILDNKVVSAGEIERLAKLPPRQQLLAELAGALGAPMAALANALEGKLQEMSGLLDALKEQKGGEGASPAAEAPAAEAEAEAASADAAAEAPSAEVEEEAQPSDPGEEAPSADAAAEAPSAEVEEEAPSADTEEEAQPSDPGEEAQPPDAEDEN